MKQLITRIRRKMISFLIKGNEDIEWFIRKYMRGKQTFTMTVTRDGGLSSAEINGVVLDEFSLNIMNEVAKENEVK